MGARIIRKVAKLFINFYVRKDKTSVIKCMYPRGKNFRGRITLSKGSSLTMGNNIKFDGALWILNNSEVTIEDGCEFKNVTIIVNENSKVFIGKNSFIS